MENPEQRKQICERLNEEISSLKDRVTGYYGDKEEAARVFSEKKEYLANAQSKRDELVQKLYELEGELERLNDKIESLHDQLSSAPDNEKESIRAEISRVEERKSRRKDTRSEMGWEKSELEYKVGELRAARNEWSEKLEFAKRMHEDLREKLQSKRDQFSSLGCNEWF